MEEVFLSNNLAAINIQIWQMLEQAVKIYRAPFHWGVLATINKNKPELRSVIVRKVNADLCQIFFHTDIRSPKIKQLQQHCTASWLFYDAPSKIQLRMNATVVIHTDDAVADESWENSKLAGKLTYSTSSPAGTLLETPELINLNEKSPDENVLLNARRNFCVVETQVLNSDWVYLHHSGNRRAYFDYQSGNQSWMQV